MASIKGSQNPFPHILIEEVASDGSATGTPAADFRHLFLGEDGALHLKDSAAAVTDIVGAAAHIADTSDAHDASAISIVDAGTYFTGTDVEAALQELGAGGGGSVATDAIWDAAGDLALGTGANTAAKLAIGTSGYVLTSNGTTAAWAAAGGLPAAKAWLSGNDAAEDIPASPNATYDDEFDDTTGMSGTGNGLAAKWAWRNQGSTTATFGTQGYITLSCAATASDNFRIIEIAAFADGTYEAKVSLEGVNTNAMLGGVALIDGTNGDFYACGVIKDSGTSNWGFVVQRWNSVTSWNANIGVVSDIPAHHRYIRITKSGTALGFWHSDDGIGWVREATTTDAVSADRIGLFVNETNNTGLTKLHVDYFRKVA